MKYVVGQGAENDYRWLARMGGKTPEWTTSPYRAKEFLSRLRADEMIVEIRKNGIGRITDLFVLNATDARGLYNGVKKNPPLVIFANPRRLTTKAYRVPSGNVIGEIGEVYAIVYRHSETRELMVHGFGPDGEDVDLQSLADGVAIRNMNIETRTGTFLYAVQEGFSGHRTVRLSHVEGEPLWDDRS